MEWLVLRDGVFIEVLEYLKVLISSVIKIMSIVKKVKLE